VRVGTSRGLGYRSGATDNQNDVLVLQDWPYDAQALAATVVTINTRTHQIVDADVAFNASAHHFRVVDALTEAQRHAQTLDDIQNTVTHELGHALGLMHNLVDTEVVMYPSAAPLEISKRVLAADDRAGLAALYGGSQVADAGVPAELAAFGPVTGGCSAGSSSAPAALLTLMLLVLRRRRSGLVLALAPALALAAAPTDLERLAPDLDAASQVSVAQVRSTRTVRLPSAPGLLFTEVELETRACLKGPCAAAVVLIVPGGREGDLEQIVAHQPVPAAREQVLLVTDARTRRLLRLEDRVQRDQAALALRRSGLLLPGSSGPQPPVSPPAAAAQVPGTAR